MPLSRAQLKKRGTTLSGLSSEIIRDANGNLTCNVSEDEIFVDARNGDFRLKGPFAKRLAGLGAPDFHLQPGSPAIGAGVPVPQVKVDFDGYPRDPVHPSIGAYEYHGSPSDGPPIVYQEPTPTPTPSPTAPWQPSPQSQPVPTEVIHQQQEREQATSKIGVPLIVAGVIAAALLFDD
jgi:hypothetical protein